MFPVSLVFEIHSCLCCVWISLLGGSQQGLVRSVQRAEVWNETLIDWENSRQHGEQPNSTRAEVTERQGCRRVNEGYAGGVSKDPGLVSHPDLGSVCMAQNMPWFMQSTRTLQTKGHLNYFRYIHVKTVVSLKPFFNHTVLVWFHGLC